MGTERTGSELEERTIAFAISTIEFVSLMSRGEAASVVGKQLLRSATSIGANYREANRAESKADFIHKTSLAQKEAAEATTGRKSACGPNSANWAWLMCWLPKPENFWPS